MNFAVRSILGVFALSVLASAALANNNNATATSALVIQQPKKETSIWSGMINASRSSSMVDHQDGTREDSMDYLMRVNAKLSNAYAIRLQGGYSQDLNYSEKNDFADTSINLMRSPMKLSTIGRYVLIGYRAGLTAPTSKDSYKRQSLQTSVSGGLSFAVNPDRLVPGFEVLAGISAGRNIHQYETALDGRVNNQYTSAQTLNVGYNFKYGLSISGEFIHKNAWSYQGNVRDTFEMSQELGYEISPLFAVAIGHTNAGSSLRPNGNDSNVQLVDENTSLIYGSLTVTF